MIEVADKRAVASQLKRIASTVEFTSTDSLCNGAGEFGNRLSIILLGNRQPVLICERDDACLLQTATTKVRRDDACNDIANNVGFLDRLISRDRLTPSRRKGEHSS